MSSYRQVGTVLTDHVFAVPLDHDRPDGEQIEVFAREVVAADRSPAGLPCSSRAAPGSAPSARTAATAGSTARSPTTGCC